MSAMTHAPPRERFRRRLDERPLLADGGMGSLMYGRGVPQSACLDELVVTRPQLVGAAHREYLDAGAELPAYGDVLSRRPAAGWTVELGGSALGPLPDLGLGPDDRVLTCLPPVTVDALVGLLAPLGAGAALVLAPGPVGDEALGAERITASAGVDVPGARRLL